MTLALVYSSFSAQTSFPWIVSFACVSVIAACHWLAGLIAARPEREQQRWASLGGGAGVAYVFLHLMPALSSGGSELSDAPGMLTFVPTPMVEALLFLIALVGFACFFSIDVFASQSKKTGSWVAMLHGLAFASINYLYAYTLPSLITTGRMYGLLFTLVISAHVLLADRTMACRHPLVYRRRYRWLGTSALAIGFTHAALFHPVSDLTLAMATAFLGGGLLISVFREELPSFSSTRLWWFLAGIFVMSLLLLKTISFHAH